MRTWIYFGLYLALLGLAQSPSRADFGPLTGNAETDLPSGNSNVITINDATNDVAQAPWMTGRGWTTGWNIKDLRIAYDWKSDTLLVGVNFVGIAGDADGNGNPGSADPLTIASGGLDLPNMGGRKSISVGFAGSNGGSLGDPFMVAGVPAIKTPGGGGGLLGFQVSSYADRGGLGYDFGNPIPGVTGDLAFNPSAAHPDFVFTVSGASKATGFNATTGFYVSAFAGSPDDVIAGEDTVGWVFVPGFPRLGPPQVVPEPSSFVLLGLGGALVGRRMLRRRSASVAGI
ncbi:MAG: PEP-CTERM sorting domain-containing protein [Isosphaeraceae bacterium]|nr:PEP-CTERM sorting domain-containing protein [Isosphaeraceae bacterium]